MAGPLVKTTSRQAPQVAPPVEAPWVNPWDEEIRKHMERLSATKPQPMYSPEEVQQRRQDNDNDYELGLLGTLSGHKGLQSAGGLVLKNAMEQRQRKITEHGSSDQISGEFTYDPDYTRQLEENKLDAMQKLKMSADLKHDADEKDADLKRALANQKGDLAMAVKGLGAAGAAAGMSAAEGRKMTVEDRMADDYSRETKPHQLVVNTFKSLQATAKRNDPASDMAFIFQYMKMLDPGSVVREGEFASAQNAAGVPDRIRNAYNRVLNGAFLNPQQRTEMLGTAGRLAGVAQESLDHATRTYNDKTRRRGMSTLQVTGTDDAPAPAAPAAGGKAPAPGQRPPVRVNY